MFLDNDLINHLQTKNSISIDSLIVAEWNQNDLSNLENYGNYRFRPDSASGQYVSNLVEYTADGGAGGSELLDWYESNPGSFYVFMSYDKPQSPTGTDYEKLNKYSDVLEVFFSDFSYNVVKRGQTNHDLWDISIALEEV